MSLFTKVRDTVTGKSLAKSLFGREQGTIQGESPEQKKARDMLLKFAETGTYGDFKAGEQLPLGIGDYNATGIEQSGLSNLQQLLNSSISDKYAGVDKALGGFLETDPQAIQDQFQPFKTQVNRQIEDAQDKFKHGAAYTGSLYNTKTIEGLGDINARGNETLTSELARLTNEQANRRLSATGTALQSIGQQEDTALARIGASQQYGGLIRQLNDAAIKARDQEILRRRQELQLPIQAAGTVTGSQYTPNVPYEKSNPYADLLGLVANVGGRVLGAKAGG